MKVYRLKEHWADFPNLGAALQYQLDQMLARARQQGAQNIRHNRIAGELAEMFEAAEVVPAAPKVVKTKQD